MMPHPDLPQLPGNQWKSRALMSQPRFEWGPGFHGYSRDWFLSGWHIKLEHNFYFSGYDS